ncbi:MAG: UDP-3-O-(3-hydroxymyristoyl) glucosamine N-acyltransferase, partial [Mesotoga prima]
LAPRKIYAGIPAKYIREVPQEQLLEEQEYFDNRE